MPVTDQPCGHDHPHITHLYAQNPAGGVQIPYIGAPGQTVPGPGLERLDWLLCPGVESVPKAPRPTLPTTGTLGRMFAAADFRPTNPDTCQGPCLRLDALLRAAAGRPSFLFARHEVLADLIQDATRWPEGPVHPLWQPGEPLLALSGLAHGSTHQIVGVIDATLLVRVREYPTIPTNQALLTDLDYTKTYGTFTVTSIAWQPPEPEVLREGFDGLQRSGVQTALHPDGEPEPEDDVHAIGHILGDLEEVQKFGVDESGVSIDELVGGVRFIAKHKDLIRDALEFHVGRGGGHADDEVLVVLIEQVFV